MPRARTGHPNACQASIQTTRPQSRFTSFEGTQLQEHTEDQVFLEVTEKKIRLFNIKDRTDETLLVWQEFLEATEKKIRLFNIRDRTEKTLVAWPRNV